MTTYSESLVVEAFKEYGWTVMQNGWPDLLVEKDGELRFIEIKQTCRQRLSPQQQLISDALAAAGIQVEVVPTRCDCRDRNCLASVSLKPRTA